MEPKPWIYKSRDGGNCNQSEWLLQYSTMNESTGSQEPEGYYSPSGKKHSKDGEKYIYLSYT